MRIIEIGIICSNCNKERIFSEDYIKQLKKNNIIYNSKFEPFLDSLTKRTANNMFYKCDNCLSSISLMESYITLKLYDAFGRWLEIKVTADDRYFYYYLCKKLSDGKSVLELHDEPYISGMTLQEFFNEKGW